MRNLVIVLLLFSVLSSVFTSKAGAKVAIKDSEVLEGFKKFSPMIISEINKADIPDQSFNVDAGIATLYVDIKKIKFDIKDIPQDNITVKFEEPKNIVAHLDGINGGGSFDAHIKLSFYKDNYPVSLTISKMVIDTVIELGMESSKQIPEKNIPSVKITKLNLDFDLDFEIHTTIIGNLVKLVKGLIKDKIKNVAIDKIKDVLIKDGHDIFSDLINKIPIRIPIYEDLYLDYSMLESPFVKENFLIANSISTLVNPKIEKTLNPPFELKDLDSLKGDLNKEVLALVTEYTINSALYTLTLSNTIKIKIPEKDLKYISIIKKIFGVSDSDELNLFIEMIEPVEGVQFVEGKIATDITFLFSFVVNEDSDPIASLKLLMSVGINLYVAENVDIKASLDTFTLKHLEISVTKVVIDMDLLKSSINFILENVKEVLNEDVLPTLHFEIPSFMGIKFNNSEVKIEQGFIEVGVTPNFSNLDLNLEEIVTIILVKIVEIKSSKSGKPSFLGNN